MKRLFVLLTLVLFTNAAAWAGSSVQSAIEAGNRKFAAAFTARDAAGVSALYTPNATAFPPGQDMVTGRDNIRKLWGGMIDGGIKFVSLTTVSVESFGRAAREIGRFAIDVPDSAGKMTRLEGKYLVVWKRVNGTWLLDCDIWNLNK